MFASFILNGDPTVKQFGVGLSVGVALAALTVLLLAPALLVLVGKQGAFWVPKWAEKRGAAHRHRGSGSPDGDGLGRAPQEEATEEAETEAEAKRQDSMQL